MNFTFNSAHVNHECNFTLFGKKTLGQKLYKQVSVI